MTLRLLGRLFVVPFLLASLPQLASAQEAVLSGTVTDLTGAVLPGVTITAVHQATGNKFTTVTDERGVYRIAARAGVYRLTAELQGFRAVTRDGLELLVGQVMTVNLPMLEATAAETVTVTAESPLLNVATSSLGGNVDSRQVQELPVNGQELDEPRNAGARKPDGRGQRDDAAARQKQRRGPGVSAQHGRPAGVGRHRDWRSAALQPGFDRGVSVRLEPVRRDPGSVVRRAGQRHHQVGWQPPHWFFPRQLPQQQVQRCTTRCSVVSNPSTISSSARHLVGRSSKTSCTTS